MLVFTFLLLLHALGALSIGQLKCISFESSPTSFSIVDQGNASPLLVSTDEWPGVFRTVSDFSTDIFNVTGVLPPIVNVTAGDNGAFNLSQQPIIVGTLGQSSLIQQVVNTTSLDISSIEDQWETYLGTAVANPLPGIDSAYVIIGSDKRGTIFALYDLSEQIGVSPWYWWADVPVTKHDSLYVTASGCSHGPPTIQYRGIFLNDEQPALQNWAAEKFTNGTGSALLDSPFNHFFYEKLFELMLRLKANYLWPAMWSSAFAVDDALNQETADSYGIAMGTSHQEPMMRSTPNEFTLFGTGPWNYTTNSQEIYEYWVNGTERAKPYESVFTLGMRGDGDLPLSETTNIDLLEEIVSDQRQILTDVYNGTNVTTIPQIWTLYEEVEGYYQDGMRVPDDVALLWTDDTWGNVRRYPTIDERNRSGGAGVYYHLDLVGSPRDYKWITTTQISKVYEQMSIAVVRNATRMWMLNVGDLKPYERETEFFLTYGWNSSIWTPDNLDDFVTEWAQREFAFSDQQSQNVAEIVANLTRFNARRKLELINSTTYNLVTYREADTILSEWETLVNASTALYDGLSTEQQPSFFQLVQHPVLASSNLGHMYIYAGLNNLRASQAFLSTNDFADSVEELFETDFTFETQYHTMLDGKWDHMMDQTHLGYFYWQQPMTNSMPPVSRVQKNKQALAGAIRIAVEGSMGAWPGDNSNQCSLGYNCPPPTLTIDPFDVFGTKYIIIGAGGPTPFTFNISTNASWLQISPSEGSTSPSQVEQRVYASVNNWDAIVGDETASITITAEPVNQSSLAVLLFFTATNTAGNLTQGFEGFVESSGVVSIEASHSTRNNTVDGLSWKELPGIGKTLSGVTPWPRTDANFSAGTGPSLEYDFHTFNSIGNNSITVITYVSPSLNANGDDEPLAFAIQVDDSNIQSSYFIPPAAPGSEPVAWGGNDGFVANAIVTPSMEFTEVAPGAHTLKLFMIEQAVVVQKLVIDTGGLVSSYLGPPESLKV